MKPRQLRALVTLLVLLPLLPTAFVVRFLVEAIYSEHLDSKERIRPVYRQLLTTSSNTLATSLSRQLPSPRDADLSETGWPPEIAHEVADAVLKESPDGTLSRWGPTGQAVAPSKLNLASERLARALVETGTRYAAAPSSGPVRWRFLSENPEAVFALRPYARTVPGGASVLLIKTRRHLLDSIAAFYTKALDPQSVLRIVDENGEPLTVVGPGDPGTDESLAEIMLPPPLPAWRLQITSVDTGFVDGLASEQLRLSFWAVSGMVLVTGTISGLAGLFLLRRIALQEMKNDILAIVSHEMRTPLASMRMFIDTLLERRYRGGPEQVDEYLRFIAQENARLERLAESFLTLSRLDAQRGHGGGLKLAPTDITSVVEAAIECVRPRLEAPHCHFTLESVDEPAVYRLRADAEALTTVLVNLLENALKYTGDEKFIRLRQSIEAGQICIAVSDNGQGIPKDEQGKIFERFYQSDRRLARSHDGAGLGLSLVRSIVRAHGGTVTVQSAPDEGSTFTVRLPLAETVATGAPVVPTSASDA